MYSFITLTKHWVLQDRPQEIRTHPIDYKRNYMISSLHYQAIDMYDLDKYK